MYTKVQKVIISMAAPRCVHLLTECYAWEEAAKHFRHLWVLQADVVSQRLIMHLTSGGPNHDFVLLTLDLQHLLVTPGAIPLSLAPGIPQPDHEELLSLKRECEPFSKVQLPNCSHWVGMTDDETHGCLHLIGTARGILWHQKWQLKKKKKKREVRSLRASAIYTLKW